MRADPLVAARPEDLLRCGVVLGELAERVREAVGLSRRSALVRWEGPAGRAYQQRLGALVGRLDRTGAALDEAGGALIGYSRVLAQAQELARQADALAGAADEAALRSLLVLGVGLPDVALAADAERLREKAAQVRQQAQVLEADAAGHAAAVLRVLADEAPAEGWVRAGARLTDDIGTSLVQQAVGMFHLGRDLWRSVPGVGGEDQRAVARHEALQAAKQAVQPWLLVEQVLHEVHDGRVGLAAGTVLGAALTRKLPPIGTAGQRLFRGHQFAPEHLRGLPDEALVIRDHAESWAQAHEANAFQDSIAQLRTQAAAQGRSALPADWLDRPLDLRQHEASGGHLLLKHVDARIELLQWRLRLESSGSYRSTFHGVDEAEQLVSAFLKEHREAVLDFVHSHRASRTFTTSLGGRYGTVLSREGHVGNGERLRLTMKRHEDGTVYILTAMIDP